jgi:hypothetical protein
MSPFNAHGQLDTGRLFQPAAPVMRPGDGVRLGGVNGVYTVNVDVPQQTTQAQEDAAEFSGAWDPTVSGLSLELTPGSINDGVTTFLPVVTGLSLNSGMNYIYLRCTLDHTEVDGYVVGGTITAASIQVSSTTQASDATYGRILLCTVNTSTGDITRYAWFNFSAQVRTPPTFYYWYS